MTATTARMGLFCLALCLPSLALAEAPAAATPVDSGSAQGHVTLDSARFPKAAYGVRRADGGIPVRRASVQQRTVTRYPVIVGIAY